MKTRAVAVALLVCLVVVGAKPKFPTVTAVKLAGDFEENEVAAERRYGNQVYVVTGKVVKVAKDFNGNVYVELDGPDLSLHAVRCLLHPAAIDLSARLKKGSSTSIRGRISGYDTDVIVSDCLFD